MEGKERGMKSRNKSKNRKESEEKITLQFVQLAVHMVNGKCDRLVLALITRRDTDYSLSTTQPVQSCCCRVHVHINMHTRTKVGAKTPRCSAKKQRQSQLTLSEGV